VTVPGGPASTQLHNKNSAVSIAQYGRGTISTFSVSKEGAFAPIQNITYGAEGHGPLSQQVQSQFIIGESSPKPQRI
jgi:6-phosphogluconolactonase (cycloisomerase 2 family)